MKNCIVLTAAIVLCCLCVNAQKPSVAGVPGWVTLNKLDYNNARLDREADDGYVDIDYEKQVYLQEQDIYVRHSFKIISEAGVQNRSQVSVEFDPSYQQLIFHTINIIRNGQVINKLDLSKIKTIHQEADLDNFIYNGTLQALLFVDDVRKGDVLEYSYTIKGFNPIFNNKYSDEFVTAFPSPVYNLYYKIVVPVGRTIHVKNSGESVTADVHVSGTGAIYEWKKTMVSSVHPDDHLPSWYNPYPEIMVSEFNSWKEVNNWAVALFPKNILLSKQLQQKINEIQAANATTQGRVRAALRFVQDDIRYMGIEMGVHSHKPCDPNKILKQRFGDCKEKSYLLCTMLQAMGIEASPVLINTTDKKALNEELPSPGDFDHVTVRTRLNDVYYWFDPTIAYQRGAIENIHYPDYQCGLVINDTTTGLTTIKQHAAGAENIQETFTVKNMNGDATLEVKTSYTGSFADDERSSFNNSSNYDMLQQMKKFYAYYFEKIKADSLTFDDNDSTGMFTTAEYYTVKDFWTLENGTKKALLSPFVIESLVKKPDDQIRTMPYAMEYGGRYHEEVIVNLPEKWDVDTASFNIHSTAFNYSGRFLNGYKQVTLNFDYETLKDNVLPAEIDDFLADIKTTSDKQSLKLTYGNTTVKSNFKVANSANIAYMAIAFLLLVGGIVWWTQRR
jgi:transglutaminase-like putative cysteine protease